MKKGDNKPTLNLEEKIDKILLGQMELAKNQVNIVSYIPSSFLIWVITALLCINIIMEMYSIIMN